VPVTLGETQALFWALLNGRAAAAGQIEATFQPSATLSSSARVAIYQDMVVYRLVDALREEFPKTVLALGDEAFYGLAENYVRAHPSDDPNIAKVGRLLSDYLRRTAAANEARPDLADLALLEWTRNVVFESDLAEGIAQQTLAELGPERLIAAELTFVPQLRLLRFERDPLALWQALEEDEAPPEPEPTALRRAAVWRAGFEVFHTGLEDDEGEALELAIAAQPLAVVCEPFASRESPAEAAFSAIGSWFAEGWVQAVTVPTMD
jgi:hypothetical protein